MTKTISQKEQVLAVITLSFEMHNTAKSVNTDTENQSQIGNSTQKILTLSNNHSNCCDFIPVQKNFTAEQKSIQEGSDEVNKQEHFFINIYSISVLIYLAVDLTLSLFTVLMFMNCN